jgi:hypothetical protein
LLGNRCVFVHFCAVFGGFLGPWALPLTAMSDVLESYGGGPGRIASASRLLGSLASAFAFLGRGFTGGAVRAALVSYCRSLCGAQRYTVACLSFAARRAKTCAGHPPTERARAARREGAP